MVSLLFVTNSPVIENVKTALQPLLKAKIDVVSDFDHGLKDVFEKRPSTVCIQEQIAGVTGESVARHIQMLLGSSAPSFILMHEGNPRTKKIKGLFDHLIDLNQPADKLVADILATLQSLLGSQWDKIYISPVTNTMAQRAAAIMSPETKQFADQLVDDLISDLDSLGPDDNQSGEPKELSVDDCVSLLTEQANSVKTGQPAAVEDDNPFVIIHETSAPVDVAVMAPQTAGSIFTNAVSDIKPETAAVSTVETEQQRAREVIASMVQKPVVAVEPGAGKLPEMSAVSAPASALAAKPADFTVSAPQQEQETIPEDLLLEFEKNFRSQSVVRSKMIAGVLVAAVVIGGGGWYLSKTKPQLFSFLNKKTAAPANKAQSTPAASGTAPASAVKTAPSAAPATTVAPANHKNSASQPSTPAAAKTAGSRAQLPALPSFIPVKGRDAAFAARKPGWERYVGTHEDFRLFRADGQLKAIQVLSLKGKSIGETRLKEVLQLLTGTDSYKITSTEQKLGFKVSRGVIDAKGEVLVYRKQGVIKAFVVSLK